MKSMTLKNKLVSGSLAMVVLVMTASAVAVSFVINQQSKTASFQDIVKSLNVIRGELSTLQEKVASDARQMATINEMGENIKFIQDFRHNKAMVAQPLKKMALGIGQVAMTGDLWKTAIHNEKGELIAFCSTDEGGKYHIGYVSDVSKGTVEGLTLKKGKESENANWANLGTTEDGKLKARYEGILPREETVSFEDMENNLCITSRVPAFIEEYKDDSDETVKKQIGFAIAVRKLDRAFADRIRHATGLKINYFTKNGLTMGDVEEHRSLEADDTKESTDQWSLADAKIVLSEIRLDAGRYFQGVLPLYGGTQYMGAIAALQSTQIVKSNTWQMIRLLGIVYLACVLVIVPCAVWFANSLSKPINKVINTLTMTAQNVSSASAHVSTSSHQLAEWAAQQAASLQETSSSLEQMSATTQNNADAASQADRLTSEANRVVGKANDSMKHLTASMDAISRASIETSKIVKTIDEIAFQTNLLALNAAVEAARAGEAGAGFAVVADEVRNLAMRAADAARNTAALIDDTGKKVKEGNELVGQTADAFAEVSESASKVGELNGEIASTSNEQARGIEVINRAVSEMDKVIQHTAANAEESASAAQELNFESVQMKKAVIALVRLVGIGNGSSRRGSVVEKQGDASGSKHPDPAPSLQSRSRPPQEIGRAAYREIGPEKTLALKKEN